MAERLRGFNSGSKSRKDKLLRYYEYFNIATLIAALGIGGVLGLTLAAIDITQVAVIRNYRKKTNR